MKLRTRASDTKVRKKNYLKKETTYSYTDRKKIKELGK